MVCWDQWYPEGARLMALAGAEILLFPTAIGWDPRDSAEEKARQRDAWITIQRSHAVANGLPVVVCNRTGMEPDPSGQSPGIEFWGSSFVTGPQGEILAQAADDKAAILTIELDLGRTETVRRAWPFLRDRRVDAYQNITRRFAD
jgi:N-carbamoylputrescine amidase